MRTGAFSKILATIFVISLVGLIAPFQADAQSPDMQAIALKKQAMTAYGDLNLDTAIRLLDQAAAMGPQLSSNAVAQIYVSYGLVYVGGHGDNARGQEYFTIAKCLDTSVGIDPLYSTPEVDMIFKMAQSRATPQACPSMLTNVSYMGAGAPQPVQPMPQPQPAPVQPMPMQPGMLPPCGMHNAPIQQRKSMELPLAIQMDPNRAASLDRIVIKYAYDGSATYFEMAMSKAASGWVTGMLSCDEGQISAFDPSTIAYYIEGYDMAGGLVCGHGSGAQPFTVTMNPNAAVVSGLPGMNPPQTCEECPPWDQDCHADKGVAIPCFADDECLEGQWCSDTGYCEGDAVGEGGDGGWDEGGGSAGGGPQTFYVNITAGTGFGIVNAPNASHLIGLLDQSSGDPELMSYDDTGFSGAAWGGLPLRLNLGFVISPKFALEFGFRIDLHSAIAKQKELLTCAPAFDDGYFDRSTGYTCSDPNPDSEGIYSVWSAVQNGSVYLFSEKKGYTSKAWLANVRGRFKFMDKGKVQGSFFAGLGYGHLFYAPKKSDLDLDGTNDPFIVTPGMINIELGPGIAVYPSRHFGFIFDLPIDMMVGEDGSFGLNVELAVGISFGG